MLKHNYKSSAKVVDGKLVLSFPNAINPVVWQMDSQDVKASALEVNDNKKSGYDLMLKTLKGESVHVASFEKKDEALEGLMAASRAMERGNKTMGSGFTNDGSSSFRGKGFLKGMLFVIGALVVIFVLMNILASVTLRAGGGVSGLERAAVSAPTQSGVPVSADDFLRSR